MAISLEQQNFYGVQYTVLASVLRASISISVLQMVLSCAGVHAPIMSGRSCVIALASAIIVGHSMGNPEDWVVQLEGTRSLILFN